MIRVLVVEDDLALLDDLVFLLRNAGFEADGLASGARLEQYLTENAVDVLVLDLGLPDADGIDIARQLSVARPDLSVVMLSGRNSPEQRVLGLESGADIYLNKTAEFTEIVASIRAVARRIESRRTSRHALRLDIARCVLIVEPHTEIPLTRQEVRILTVFAQIQGGEASRKQLIEGLGGNYMTFDQRRLETVISRLRRKLSVATGIEKTIRAMRGDGYLFTYPLTMNGAPA